MDETTAQLSRILTDIEAENQRHSQQTTALLQHFQAVFLGMGGIGAQPERLLFGSPVTGVISNTPNPFGLDWYDATGYATYYTASGKPAYHTGADLNRVGFGDSGKPVYTSADGVIVFSGIVSGWQGRVVVIKHTLETGEKVWTRYAHIRDTPQIGQIEVPVKRGDPIGVIADYTPTGKPEGDHLHFDVCRDDLGSRPGDWPGTDKARVIAQYIDPAKWLKERKA